MAQAPLRPARRRLALLLLSPLLLAIALSIKLDSPGPVFFRQQRVGRHGAPFRIHKFRTMVADAPQRGPALTVGDDARITRAGRWLRRTRLDELPQLIDVLAGHMSLVGPRPEVPQYVAHYPAALRERALSVRPGITDPSSLLYLDESELLARAADPEREYVEVILPRKLQCAAAYAAQATLRARLSACCVRTLRMLARALTRHGRRRTERHAPSVWHRLDLFLARLRPHREPLSLLVDALVIAACWNITYLFRLGFERWISARPGYDLWVLLGVVAVYLVAFAAVARAAEHVALFGLRRGQAADAGLRAGRRGQRRGGHGPGPEQGAARGAGAAPGGHADGRVRGAHRLPHALRTRALAHHRRQRRDPPRARAGRGRGGQAGCWPASTSRAGSVLGLLDDDPAKQRRAHRRRAGAGPAGRGARQAQRARRGHAHRHRPAFGHAGAAPPRAGAGRGHRPAGADGAQRRRAGRPAAAQPARARHRARRPARPRAGAAGRSRHRRHAARQDGADHRRRRQHRQRAVPPGGALRAGAAGAVRAERVQPLHASSRSWASASRSCRWCG